MDRELEPLRQLEPHDELCGELTATRTAVFNYGT
jgi:hypothetical protein